MVDSPPFMRRRLNKRIFGGKGVLRSLLSCLVAVLVGSNPVVAFESYEHSEIGDEAFKKAVGSLDRSGIGSWSKLSRQPFVHAGPEVLSAVSDGREIARVSFGDLVAIYGDYAVRFEDVNGPAFEPRVRNLKAIVRGDHSSEFEDERDYAIKLAVNNVTHFSLAAAQAYVLNHRRALLLARQKSRLWQALHYEALALHSLTDLFAFGHMHEDRQLTDRVIAWGDKRHSPTGLSRATRQAIASTAAKAMGAYVNFYHNGYNWRGAMMKNLAGDIWRGYGDKRYRLVDAGCTETTNSGKRKCPDLATERQREIIVHAASVSLLSVLRTAAGRLPLFGEEFIAMCYLPVTYWDTNRPIGPENQKLAISQMASAMEANGTPLEKTGFDFSLGFLKYQRKEMRGSVDYIEYVRQYCGKL